MFTIHLERLDQAVIAGSVLIPLGLAAAAYGGIFSPDVAHSLASTLSAFHPLLFMIGAVYVALSWDRFDPEVTRSLQVIAAGFMAYAALYYPHKVMWHGPGFGGKTPDWASFSAGAWEAFFHTAAVIALGVVAYGIYLFWQGEQS